MMMMMMMMMILWFLTIEPKITRRSVPSSPGRSFFFILYFFCGGLHWRLRVSPENFPFPIVLTGTAAFEDLIWHNMSTDSQINTNKEGLWLLLLLKNFSIRERGTTYQRPSDILVFGGQQQFLTESIQTDSKLCSASAEAKFFSTWCVVALKRPWKAKATIIALKRNCRSKNCSKKSEKCHLRSRIARKISLGQILSNVGFRFQTLEWLH